MATSDAQGLLMPDGLPACLTRCVDDNPPFIWEILGVSRQVRRQLARRVTTSGDETALLDHYADSEKRRADWASVQRGATPAAPSLLHALLEAFDETLTTRPLSESHLSHVRQALTQDLARFGSLPADRQRLVLLAAFAIGSVDDDPVYVRTTAKQAQQLQTEFDFLGDVTTGAERAGSTQVMAAKGPSADWVDVCRTVTATSEKLRHAGPSGYLLVQLRESVEKLDALARKLETQRIVRQIDHILSVIDELTDAGGATLKRLSDQIVACWRLAYLSPNASAAGFDDDFERFCTTLPGASSDWAHRKAELDHAEAAYEAATQQPGHASLIRRPNVELSKKRNEAEQEYKTSTQTLLAAISPGDQPFDLDRDYVADWSALAVNSSPATDVHAPEPSDDPDGGGSDADAEATTVADTQVTTDGTPPDTGCRQSTPMVDPEPSGTLTQSQHDDCDHGSANVDATDHSAPSAPSASGAPEAESTDPLPASHKSLPPELQSWSAFQDAFWLDTTGQCSAAPWLEPGFLATVDAGLNESFREPSFWRMYVFAVVLRELQPTRGLLPEDVVDLASVWQDPKSTTGGVSTDRVAHVRELMANSPAVERDSGSTRPLRLALLLEAIRPAPDTSLSPAEVATAMAQASFHTGMEPIIASLLRSNAHGIAAPIDHLRRAWERTSRPSKEDLADQLNSSRTILYDTMTELHVAAGGRIQRTHCRKAWATFVSRTSTRLRPLFPVDRGGDRTLKPGIRGQDVLREHALAADRGGAKYQDRRSMDRAARRIADHVEEIVRLTADLARHSRTPATASAIDLSPQALDVLKQPDGDDVDILCAKSLRLVLERRPGIAFDPFLVDHAALARWPDLMWSIDQGELLGVLRDPRQTGVPATAIRDMRHASAVLLEMPPKMATDA